MPPQFKEITMQDQEQQQQQMPPVNCAIPVQHFNYLMNRLNSLGMPDGQNTTGTMRLHLDLIDLLTAAAQDAQKAINRTASQNEATRTL